MVATQQRIPGPTSWLVEVVDFNESKIAIGMGKAQIVFDLIAKKAEADNEFSGRRELLNDVGDRSFLIDRQQTFVHVACIWSHPGASAGHKNADSWSSSHRGCSPSIRPLGRCPSSSSLMTSSRCAVDASK